MMRHKPIALLSLVSGMILFTGIFMSLEKKHVFPGVDWYWYTDSKQDGDSDFELTDSENPVSFEFKLNNRFPYPFVGLCFTPDRPMDLSSYDFMNIDISAEATKTLRFFIKTVIPEYSDPDDHLTYPHYEADIPVWENKGSYRFPLDDIQLVFWWYDAAGWDADKFPVKKSFSQVAFFDLQSGEMFDMDEPARVVLREIYFTRNPLPVLITSFFLAALCWVIGGTAILIIRLKIPSHTVLSTNHVRQNPGMEEATCRITNAIAESWGDKNFSMNALCKKTGLAASTISRKLKAYCGLSFSHYLALIRLHEAKRLLSDTNLTIEDISSRIGFKSRTHFIGLFSEKEGLSPAQYRKEHTA